MRGLDNLIALINKQRPENAPVYKPRPVNEKAITFVGSADLLTPQNRNSLRLPNVDVPNTYPAASDIRTMVEAENYLFTSDNLVDFTHATFEEANGGYYHYTPTTPRIIRPGHLCEMGFKLRVYPKEFAKEHGRFLGNAAYLQCLLSEVSVLDDRMVKAVQRLTKDTELSDERSPPRKRMRRNSILTIPNSATRPGEAPAPPYEIKEGGSSDISKSAVEVESAENKNEVAPSASSGFVVEVLLA